VVVYYWLKEKPKSDISVEFLDASGKLVKKFSSKESPGERARGEAAGGDEEDNPRQRAGASRVPAEAGMNRFVWDMRYPDATTFPGLIMWAGSVRGPLIVPGKYQVRLTADGETQTHSFTVKKDPRSPGTQSDFEKQLAMLLQLRDKLSAANEGVIRIRDAKRQLDAYASSENKAVADGAKELAKKLTVVENELYQTKNQSGQDPLNFPIKLNNKLAALAGVVAATDVSPTAQAGMVYEELASRTNVQLKEMESLLKDGLAAFNRLVRDEKVPAVVLKPVKKE
jgi:hypothetical protein